MRLNKWRSGWEAIGLFTLIAATVFFVTTSWRQWLIACIERYGEKSGAGQEVLHWVEQNYEKAARTGGDPLDYREHGAIILRKYR
jgi:hypothetical protein